MIRTLTLTTLLLLATLAFAQAPNNVAHRITEELYAEQFSCESYDGFAAMIEGSDEGYCGFVSDTMTDLNKRLVGDAYAATGYTAVEADWTVEWMDTGELHMGGYTNSTYVSVVGLLVDYEEDSTVVIITFDLLD